MVKVSDSDDKKGTMANPFLARLLDTQQRGLQAERERQMRNDAFGNLGFLGQSLQRSFQPLAEMRQKEALQTQAEQARRTLQQEQQAFDKQKAIDETAAKYNLGFDKERNRYYKEGGYDPLSRKIVPGKRTYVSPAEIQSNIELEKAKKLAGFATDENLRQNRGLLDQKFGDAVRNLQGIYNPADNSVRIPTGYNNETKQVIYGEPMSLQEAKNLSDQRNLKATEETKSKVRVDESEKLLDDKDRRAAEKMGIKYDPATNEYYREESEDGGDKVIRVPVKFEEVRIALDAQKSKAVTRATGEAETEVLVGREKRLRPEKIKTLKEEYATKLTADKNRYEFLTRDQLEDQLEIAVRQAKQIGDDDLARRLEEFGAQPYESLADAKNRNKYNALIDELGVRLDFKIEEATNLDLLDAELDRAKALKDVDYASLREHEKIIATDTALQEALIKNLENRAAATAKGQDTVEIDRERRKIGYETLSKGINALIETDNNITVEQIKDLATGTGLSEEALTQMVYSANAQGTRTRIQRKKDLASNPALTKQQQFEILQTIPKDQGGLRGTGLEFKNYEVNGKILDHLIDRGEELTDAELESAGYVTKNSKDLVKKLAGNNKNKRVLQDIATQVSSALQGQPTDAEQRKVFLKELYEGLRADPEKKAALDSKGYDYNWFKGNADKIAREIEKEVADINYKNASAVGQLTSSSKASESTIDKVFRQRMSVLFERYETDPKQLLIEESRLRANLYGSSDAGPGGTAVPGGPTTSMKTQMFSGPGGNQENQTSQPNKEKTVEDNVVAETETNTSSPTVDRARSGFLDREPESSRGAALQSLESGLDTLNPDASFTKLVKNLNSFFGGKEGSKDTFNQLAEANGGVDKLLKLLETKSDDEIYDFVYESTGIRSPKIRKDIVKAVQESRDFKTNLYD